MGVEAFIGSWREEIKIGYDEMATALGLPPEKKEFFKNAKTEITYAQDGDKWVITVGMQGVPNTRTFQFKLGEEYQSASLDGSPLTSKMTADGDKFLEEHVDESMNNMKMLISRHIEGDKMVVVTKVGNLEMQSKYGRI
ncbi:fatty acid-binding protein type 2-like isoform X3 [Ruditapes philippinarum]|uniref:fatty acid-binding protein type 2-like isoform X2 n=1 Tax=Ruditapes philippinarum TaxID=129788 RepID=UPI00295A983C|nr:fatty acid-binding protein type 2-like isoform X2 [Ruditapes philippinarum]XP_060599634.1 fatty acid-binding protein type 2-like isoform X3 [Ruditapes philippinarum]